MNDGDFCVLGLVWLVRKTGQPALVVGIPVCVEDVSMDELVRLGDLGESVDEKSQQEGKTSKNLSTMRAISSQARNTQIR